MEHPLTKHSSSPAIRPFQVLAKRLSSLQGLRSAKRSKRTFKDVQNSLFRDFCGSCQCHHYISDNMVAQKYVLQQVPREGHGPKRPRAQLSLLTKENVTRLARRRQG